MRKELDQAVEMVGQVLVAGRSTPGEALGGDHPGSFLTKQIETQINAGKLLREADSSNNVIFRFPWKPLEPSHNGHNGHERLDKMEIFAAQVHRVNKGNLGE